MVSVICRRPRRSVLTHSYCKLLPIKLSSNDAPISCVKPCVANCDTVVRIRSSIVGFSLGVEDDFTSAPKGFDDVVGLSDGVSECVAVD